MKRREFLKAIAATTFLKHIPSVPGAPVVNTITFQPNYCQLIILKARQSGYTKLRIGLERAASVPHFKGDPVVIKWMKECEDHLNSGSTVN